MKHPLSFLLRFGRSDDDRLSLLGDLEEEGRARTAAGRGRISTFAWQTGQIVAACAYGARDSLRASRRASLSRFARQLGPDLKLSIRLLFKYPGLTLVSGLGITVGIAICAGFFAFAYALLYPTLPLDEGDRVVALRHYNMVTRDEDRQLLPDFVTWRDRMTTVVDIGAFQQIDATVQTGTWQRETVRIARMTAAGFTLARVPPLMGRFLTPEDERPEAPPVLVIGSDVWRSRFGQDPSVVGQQVRIGDTIHTVVGVMPDGFKFPVNHQYWTPLRANLLAFERGAGPELFVFARLARGGTLASAQAELAAIGRQSAAAFPVTHAHLKPMVVKYAYVIGDIDEGIELAVHMMELLVSMVLVVVAFNVAILVYARTAYRRREIAVRTALGASRLRIVMQLSAEALALAVVPAIAGVAVAQYGMRLGLQLEAQTPEFGGAMPFWTDYSLQPATVGYVLALVIVTVLIVGVLPALQATRRNVTDEIRQLGSGVRLGRTWGVLVVAQVALAVAALPAALRIGLTEVRHALTRPSYPIEEFLGVNVTMEEGTERLGHRLRELERRLEAEPDIAGVTFMASLPGRGGGRVELMEATGNVLPAPGAPASRRMAGIAPDYFNLYGLRMLAGRPFETGDARDVRNPVIVDQTFVHTFLNGGYAVGRRVRYAARSATGQPSPWYEIVGVTENLQTNPVDARVVPPTMFYPVTAEQISSATLRLRIRGPAADRLSDLPQRLHRLAGSVDPALRLGEIRSSASIDMESALTMRLLGTGLALVMGTVLLLSAAGVYALMSFTVAQRRREIGIRTALGASRRRVLHGIFSRAGVQIGIGVLAGIAAAVAIDSWVVPAIGWSEVSGSRAIVISAVALITVAVGFLAALGPARRGLRIQPTEALKAE